MGTLRLKAPPPPSVLAAIARTAGQPRPGSALPLPASVKPAKARRTPEEIAAAKYATAKAMPRKSPEAKAKALTAMQQAICYQTRLAKLAAENQRAAWRMADIALCRERFPGLFDPDRPLPLTIGARKPIAALVGIQRARRLLAWWTEWPGYLAAVVAGDHRYHLDGTKAEVISQREREIAQAALNRSMQLEHVKAA